MPGPAPEGPACLGRDDELLRLASRLPVRIRLGVSSRAFAAPAGDNGEFEPSACVLPEDALANLARHPLLRTAGVDRTFHAPVREADYARLAASVPAGLRLVVKAPQSLTATYRHRSREGDSLYLDPVAARDLFVDPCLAGLGAAAGPLVFLFPPQGRDAVGDPPAFAARLERFLRGLPEGPLYAVELRDRQLAGTPTIRALAAAGARLCLAVHARMPPVHVQAAAATSLGAGPLVVRWNLRPGIASAGARKHHAPIDRVIDESPATRSQIARLCRECAASDQDAWVIASDETEGSALEAIERLAQAIAGT